MKAVRTRFAPSPTGYMHVGGVRTALFAWLLARQSGGQFLLRIEDTDQAREIAGSSEHIIKSLRWLGLEWDEGVDKGGPFGPYKQSERLSIYQDWAQKLFDQGRAYADPYSPQELDTFRSQAKTEKRPFLFREHRPENPPTWNGSQPLRLKSTPKNYTWHDEVMGELATGPEVIDDFILVKSDGYPTYNFAHIIDDHLMQISHVIRSQEFLASMPKYLNLYEALELEPPTFVTVPFVMAPDGKKKLSKRDGAKDILDYTKEGYLPEALFNFIVTLGWNDGTEQEIFSVDEIIAKFDPGRIQKNGAKFDEQRLQWMNGYHIRHLSVESLYEKVSDFWPPEASKFDDAYKKAVLALVQERLKFFAELPQLTNFFFDDLPIDSGLIANNKQLQKLPLEEVKSLLEHAKTMLEQSDFSLHDLSQKLNQLLITTGQKPGVLFSLIRIATTSAPASPGLAETMEVLGKEVSLRRINNQLDALSL